jgi:hypothetical protein
MIVAPQIDRRDPVVGFLAQFVEWLVAAADRNADAVVEDVESAPAPHRFLHRRRQCRLARHVGPKSDAFATLRYCQRGGLLG